MPAFFVKMDRIFFHIDVNSAFLSWSAIYRLRQGDTVDLRTVPSIVGGDREKRHGIVLAKSIPAKKYGIDFALKKTDDRYLVFFKGRDADVLTAAFREFSKKKLDKERKPSVRRDISTQKAEAAKRNIARDKVKNKDRGLDL